MKTSLILFFISYTLIGYSQQTLQTYTPVSSFSANLSNEKEQEINRQAQLLEKSDLTKSESIELDTLLRKYGEVVESMWDIIDGGCSWYCGGGNYKVEASSELKSNNSFSYSASSANDLSYNTAWVEGKGDEGIGEYLDFFFENSSPRVTSIIISNGYQKSEEAWKNNNRVKALKLYVNGNEFGILLLENKRTDQRFNLGTFGRNTDGTELVLRFEIVDVFKGDKYNDTAITEIYFDGIDVH